MTRTSWAILRTLSGSQGAYRVRKIAPAVVACREIFARDFAHPTIPATFARGQERDIIAHLLRMDAVGIERRHRIATRLLVLVGGRAKPEHRVVDPFWRIVLASDEGERIERARH